MARKKRRKRGNRSGYRSPGVYVEEVPSGARPLEGVGTAVAASCAIPGFYRSVRIGDRRYVDGGVHSTSNLDLLAGEGLDLVICLNPTSSLYPSVGLNSSNRCAERGRQKRARGSCYST